MFDSLVEATLAAKILIILLFFFLTRLSRLLTSIELGASSHVLTLWTVS